MVFIWALLWASSGCDRNVGTIDLLFLTPPGGNPFDSVDSLFVRIAIDGKSPRRDELVYVSGEEVTIPDISVSETWTVSVSGETRGGAVLSRGRSLPFKIHEGSNVLELYFAAVGEREGFSRASDPIAPGKKRGGHAAVELVDGRVALIGGGDTFSYTALEISNPVQEIEIFDPTTGRIVEAGQCLEGSPPGTNPLCLLWPRLNAAIGRTSNGDILVVGGGRDASLISNTERLPRGESTFVPVDLENPLSRLDAELLQINDGALLLGGRSSESDAETYFVREAVHFSANGSRAAEYEDFLKRGRAGAAMASVTALDGQILVFGGYGYEQTIYTLLPNYEVISMSPVSGASTPQALDELEMTALGPITERSNAVATVIDDRFILVTGGQDSYGVSGEIDLFDGGTGFFCRLGDMNSPRYLHAAAPLNNGSVLVVGGVGGPLGNSPLRSVEIIDPRTAMTRMRDGRDCGDLGGGGDDPLVVPDSINVDWVRVLATATALANDMILVAGGFDGDGNAVDQHLIWVQ